MTDYTSVVTAWATVAAVVVALALGVYPIWKGRAEKRLRDADDRKRADNLRVRMIGVVDRIETAPAIKYFEELKALFPMATSLTAEEQYAAEGLYLAMCSTPGWPAQLTDPAVQDISVKARDTSTVIRQHYQIESDRAMR